MLASISPEQLDEWIAFDLLEPIALTASERAESGYRPPFQTQTAEEQLAILGISPAMKVQ